MHSPNVIFHFYSWCNLASGVWHCMDGWKVFFSDYLANCWRFDSMEKVCIVTKSTTFFKSGEVLWPHSHEKFHFIFICFVIVFISTVFTQIWYAFDYMIWHESFEFTKNFVCWIETAYLVALLKEKCTINTLTLIDNHTESAPIKYVPFMMYSSTI